MKFHQFIVATLLTVALSGCGGSIQAIRSYDSGTDFSSLTSYDWLPIELATFSTPEGSEHYKNEMNRMLADKEISLNSETPDFLIKTQRRQVHVDTYKSVYGNVAFRKVLLHTSFLHPTSSEIIYESTADGFLDDDEESQEKKNGIIDQAVEALLRGFPPSSE
jgi:hypothetical protein